MRPLLGEDASTGRSRSTTLDNDGTPLASRHQPPPMTFFLADEKTMDASQTPSPTSIPKPRDISKSTTYGVESLDTTISSLVQEDSDDSDDKVKLARHNWEKNLRRLASKRSEEDLAVSTSPSLKSFGDISGNASPSLQRRCSQATISRPFTPLSFGSPGPPSMNGSSRRQSDAGSDMDDVASQAIVSSSEEDGEAVNDMAESGSAPQLVMPSIKMPSRRPFTEKGKSMGRLKILVAGDSGKGDVLLCMALLTWLQGSARHRSSKLSFRSVMILFTLILYLLFPYPSLKYDVRAQRRSLRLEVQIFNPRRKSRKSTQAQKHILHGGLTWRTVGCFEGGKVWAIPFWNGIYVLLIHLVMAIRLQ